MIWKKIRRKTDEEISLIRKSSLLVSKTLGEISKYVKPGVSTIELDRIAETYIRDHGGKPAFKGYSPHQGDDPFPFTLCVSVNEEVVHGMPSSSRFLEDGDIVSIDCGVELNGFFGDSAYTFGVGNISQQAKGLMQVTQEALEKGIVAAETGKRLGMISHSIQKYAEDAGYSIVREMVGHGVGIALHEPPDVPNYGRKWSGPKLREGMVLAIEPMINLGSRFIDTADDGWTIFAEDGQLSAHYEHCVVIGKEKAELLTTFSFIEQNLN